MNIEKIKQINYELKNMANNPCSLNMRIEDRYVTQINERIAAIATEINKSNSVMSNQILNAKNNLFHYNFGYAAINPFAIGKIVGYFDLIIGEASDKRFNEWDCIHPRIIKSSKKLYDDGSYAESAVDAFIEINDRVKKLYKIVCPSDTNIPDGVDLMNKVFSSKNLLIEVCDQTTDTGKNIQLGTHFMMAGAMSALRNPKAHSNEEKSTVTKELRCFISIII